MYDLLKITMLGLFFGTFGTTLGGIIGVKFKNPSNKILSFILSLAGGLMTSILSFDLIPEALKIASITNVILGIAFGILCMIICNYFVDKKFTQNSKMLRSIKEENKKDLLRAGIVTSIGLAIHNFPEGLAIGSGFGSALTLGYSLAIAICIHDIPEGRFQIRQYAMSGKAIWIWYKYINFRVWKKFWNLFFNHWQKTNVWYKIKKNINFVSLWKTLKYYDINRIINITYNNKKGDWWGDGRKKMFIM